METILPFLLAGLVGLGHAFEADHLIAVSNIVTKRKTWTSAARDGIFWGLGHSTTILLVGFILIVGQATFLDEILEKLEALVGIMLIILGVYRLFYRQKTTHFHSENQAHHSHHGLAYGVGLIHGLAGSGTLILVVMSKIQGVWASMLYLGIFGIGSIIGMLLAVGILSLPFYRESQFTQKIQQVFIILSSILCISYGIWILQGFLS